MRFPLIQADENTVNKINKSEDLVKSPTPFMNVRAIAKKDYDTLDELRIPTFRPFEVGMFLYFDRHHANGEKFLRGEIYLAIRKSKEGKWAIHEISTILKPSDQAESLDTEAIEESRRILTLYMYTYETKNQELLKQLGWPYGDWDYEKFYKIAGSKIGGYNNSIATKIEIPQHSATKAHCLTTYLRRQYGGRPISIGRGVYITAKENGKWRWFLSGAYATIHDYSNDV